MERLLARHWPRLIAILAVTIGLLGAASLVLGADPRLKTCTTGVTGSVQSSFAMDHARDYKIRLPLMKLSPELETDEPAYVVVFSGVVSLAVVGAPAAQSDDNAAPAAAQAIRQDAATGVVCVVTNGSPTYYSGVDTSGLKQ